MTLEDLEREDTYLLPKLGKEEELQKLLNRLRECKKGKTHIESQAEMMCAVLTESERQAAFGDPTVEFIMNALSEIFLTQIANIADVVDKETFNKAMKARRTLYAKQKS